MTWEVFDRSRHCPSMAVGTRVWFADEQRPYTVQAVAGPWVVLTKPFAARATVLYTVLNRDTMLRGRDDYSGLGYETREDCEAAAAMFGSGEAEHSHRYPPIPVRLRRVAGPP